MSEHDLPEGKTIDLADRAHMWERHPEEVPPAPVKAEEGEYHEYPRSVYHADGRKKTVRSDEEKAAAMAEGWVLAPDDLPLKDGHVRVFDHTLQRTVQRKVEDVGGEDA